MKKIYSSPIAGEIPRLRNMLEGAGFTCVLRNEISAGLFPDIPMTESTPELWIKEDDRLAEALQIKADFQSSATVAEKNWQCQKCGEMSEAQFTSCWKCGAPREGQIPAATIQPGQAEPAAKEEKAEDQEPESGVPCVACGKRITPGSKYCPFCGWTQP